MPDIDADWFIATDDRPIFHRSAIPEAPKGIVLLLHGYAEHSGRYVHLIEHFAERGLAVFAPDHRGHGRSAHTLGDLESLDAVLGDIAVLHRNALARVPGVPVFLFGHSMGGMLAVLYAERTAGLAGAVFNGAALAVPEDMSPAKIFAARLLAKIAPRLGVEPFYDPVSLTSDPAIQADVQLDPLFYRGWLRARTGALMLRGMQQAVSHLHQLELPFLATHGSIDRTVPVLASTLLFDGAASTDKTLHHFEGLLHEVHNEPSRHEVLTLWSNWLEHHC